MSGAVSYRIYLPAGLKLPARMHASLQKVLQILKCGHQRVEIRLPLYGALLSYLQISKPIGATSKPQALLTAILSGIYTHRKLNRTLTFGHSLHSANPYRTQCQSDV